MNNRRGLFLAALGAALIVLSESPIFQLIASLEEHRHPMMDEVTNWVTLITFLIMATGITFLLIGTYEYMRAGKE